MIDEVFRDYLLEATGSSDLRQLEIIQSLWSGYGNISRYKLFSSPSYDTIIVKHIALGNIGKHPRGWNSDNSHNRKVRSYEIETYWYENWSHLTTDSCRIPQFIGSYSSGHDQWIIMEDLVNNYPSRKYELNIDEVKVCLSWLANFHAIFVRKEPEGLWKTGTYWHLETRPDEYKQIQHKNLKSKAHEIDRLLNQCTYKTILHGDAKLANFCFSKDSKSVAAVDFQYVGGGCGMKDVAYFLGSCLSSSDCERYQDPLLDYYFSRLKEALLTHSYDINIQDLIQEWRYLYPFAWTDFTRFLLGWMPTHQKLNTYSHKLMNSVLNDLKD